jgi:hypothetical protein
MRDSEPHSWKLKNELDKIWQATPAETSEYQGEPSPSEVDQTLAGIEADLEAENKFYSYPELQQIINKLPEEYRPAIKYPPHDLDVQEMTSFLQNKLQSPETPAQTKLQLETAINELEELRKGAETHQPSI